MPIQSVHGCGNGVTQAPIGYSYSTLLYQYLAMNNDPGVEQCIGDWFVPRANLSAAVTSILDATITCTDQPELYLQVSHDA